MKEYSKEDIEKGILRFNGKLFVLNYDKSMAGIYLPMQAVKDYKIKKSTILEITIKTKHKIKPILKKNLKYKDIGKIKRLLEELNEIVIDKRVKNG